MTANGDARKDDGIGTNPYIVANDYRLGIDALLINAFRGVLEIMVQGGHRDALRQVDVVANADRTDDGAMEPDAGIVTNGNVANSIVDATVRFDDTSLAQPETTIGWCIQTDAPVDFRPAATMLVEGCQQADIPSWTGVALVHDEVVQESFYSWARLQSLS